MTVHQVVAKKLIARSIRRRRGDRRSRSSTGPDADRQPQARRQRRCRAEGRCRERPHGDCRCRQADGTTTGSLGGRRRHRQKDGRIKKGTCSRDGRRPRRRALTRPSRRLPATGAKLLPTVAAPPVPGSISADVREQRVPMSRLRARIGAVVKSQSNAILTRSTNVTWRP